MSRSTAEVNVNYTSYTTHTQLHLSNSASFASLKFEYISTDVTWNWTSLTVALDSRHKYLLPPRREDPAGAHRYALPD